MSESDIEKLGALVANSMGPGGPEGQSLEIESEGTPVELEQDLEEMLGVVFAEDGQASFVMPGEEDTMLELTHDSNLAEDLPDAVLDELSSNCLQMFEDDQDSRDEWQSALSRGLDLLGIRYEERDAPFSGASGVTHPLISESVTQFQAQAYKELLPASGPVRTSIVGLETPETVDQASRVENFMNYYVMEVMEEYDPDMDQMLFYLPLSGSTFKKIYFDHIKGRAVSKFVPAEDVVVPYSATDLRTAERITHVTKMTENDIRRLQVSRIYRDVDLPGPGSSYKSDEELQEKRDELDGMRPSYSDDVYTILEMHTHLDLEGFEDMDEEGEPTGIKIPYTVTIERDSGKVLSIYRNYEEDDPEKRALQHFVHYKFLPGLGFYGFGLIHMIGGLSYAATSILRQLIDAGTLSNLPAGFKMRGVRIRNDDEPLQPGEFRDIDAPNGDIRNAIQTLPYKEPSGTLSQLLGVLVDSGRRYATVADTATGDMNSQAPVGTTVALLERGSRVMSAIHKRLHYAQRQEFRLLSKIISETTEAYPYALSVPPETFKTDFDGRIDILPVSDPNIFSMAQRHALAQTQLQMAAQNPELHNLREAYRRMYQALEVKNIDALLQPEQPPQPMDPATEISTAFAGKPFEVFPDQNQEAHLSAYAAALVSPAVMENPAVKTLLMSKMFQRIGFLSQQQAQQQVQAALQQQGIDPMQMQQMDPMMAQQLQMQMQQQMMQLAPQINAQLVQQYLQQVSPQPQPDPLVGIRQAEVQLQAQDNQRKAQKDAVDAQLEQARIAQSAQQAQDRLATQLEIAGERNEINRERIETQEDIAVMRELNKRTN